MFTSVLKKIFSKKKLYIFECDNEIEIRHFFIIANSEEDALFELKCSTNFYQELELVSVNPLTNNGLIYRNYYSKAVERYKEVVFRVVK